METLVHNLKKLLQDFVEVAQDLRNQPGPKEVHRLRILSRRIRAGLSLLTPQASSKADLKVQKHMQHLGKKLGKVRELDVLLEDAAAYDFNTEDLQRKRAKQARKLQKYLNRQLQEELEELFIILLVSLEDRDIDTTARLSKAIQDDHSSWPDRFPKGTHRQHQLRIQIKRTIYRKEIVNQTTTQLRLFQRNLGRAHDLEMLQEVFGKKKNLTHDINRFLKKADSIYQKISAN